VGPKAKSQALINGTGSPENVEQLSDLSEDSNAIPSCGKCSYHNFPAVMVNPDSEFDSKLQPNAAINSAEHVTYSHHHNSKYRPLRFVPSGGKLPDFMPAIYLHQAGTRWKSPLLAD